MNKFVLTQFKKKKLTVLFAGDKEKLVCSVCSCNFFSERNLRLHMNIHNKTYQCEVCLECFESKRSLDMHVRIHTGEKPYACSACDKRFFSKPNLNAHQAMCTNSDVSEFKCNICRDDRYFRTKDALSLHLLFHNEPKFHCPKCGNKFYSSTSMNQHLIKCRC